MSAGYVIAQLKVTNSENYKEYVNKVTEIVKKFDGEYLVRNGEYQSVEGEIKFPRLKFITSIGAILIITLGLAPFALLSIVESALNTIL